MKHTLPLFLFAALGFSCVEDSTSPQSEALNDPSLVSAANLLEGFPENSELHVESKADQNFPNKSIELVKTQSSVKSQGSRGVCSIFSTVAYMEHLYITEGSITDPDFSEQFLQWSAKFEVKSFPHSGGSNVYYNLRAIHRFGIPAEADWKYQSAGWGSSDNADCTGEDKDKPTECFTNGTPPEDALKAKKFHLPEGRYFSTRTRDIKSQIHNKKQAVPVGMTFFYQSWNHRRSPLTVNSGYWDKGYVLYPNADDKKHGLEKGAGHSILIVGWDDDLEIPTVDKDGKVIEDASGNAVMEKGFFLFKNSWGTGGFGKNNPAGDGYGWLSMKYVSEYGRARVTDLPTIEKPAEICGDKIDNDGNGDTDCDDSACKDDATCTATEPKTLEIASDLSIPDNDSTGVSSSFTIEDETLESMTLSIDIKHSFTTDLSIALISPDGKTFLLQEDNIGSPEDKLIQTYVVENVKEINAKGEWKLLVVDHAAVDLGSIQKASVTYSL